MAEERRPHITEPQLFAVGICASSKSSCVAGMLQAHETLLSVLRELRRSASEEFFLYQTLLAKEICELNPWLPLDPSGIDRVVALNTLNYPPRDCTVLTEGVHQLVHNLALTLDDLRREGYSASGHIAVLTNSIATQTSRNERHAQIGAEQSIQQEVQRLRDKDILRGSMLLSYIEGASTLEMLEELRDRLGFECCIALPATRPELRRAFWLVDG